MKPGRTFVEKIFNAVSGSVVYCEPDIILSHDNSARIRKLFEKMNGVDVKNPERLVVVLDRKMIGTTEELIHDYNSIHNFMNEQKVEHFFDCDKGICHQVLAGFIKPGMFVVGSDSHTCTAGAFNCLAIGVNKTETAVLWKTGKMWFQVPETIKVTLKNSLPEGVYAKDLALWVMGMLRDESVYYQSIEYHGEGVGTLTVADRMTIANVSAEMAVKNSSFPPDDVLADYFKDYAIQGVWADENAVYAKEVEIDLSQVFPLVLATHQNNEIKSVNDYDHMEVQQGLIGACASGRLEDLRVVARILGGKKLFPGFQLSIVPASREIYIQAIEEGLVDKIVKAGASILGASCGPCLGSCHMIQAETKRFISTTNSNAMSRLSEIGVEKYIASPAVVAMTALKGKICAEKEFTGAEYQYWVNPAEPVVMDECDHRKDGNVWNYGDIDNISCEQLFAERLTYKISNENGKAMKPYLLGGLDTEFASLVKVGDVIIAGENFGCGKLIKHTAIGLLDVGVKAVIVKSVNRNFFRMAINHGLLVIIDRQFVDHYKQGNLIEIDLEDKRLYCGGKEVALPEFADKFIEIIRKKGIVNTFAEE